VIFAAFVPALFKGRLRSPRFGAPLFIISVPDPGLLNARPAAWCVSGRCAPSRLLDEWLTESGQELLPMTRRPPVSGPSAPFCVQPIVHRSTPAVEQDLALCENTSARS